MLDIFGHGESLWQVPLLPTLGIVATSAIYVRGFIVARRTRQEELPPWRAWCFLAGMLVLFLALASPVDTLADSWLLAHMTQHFLLISIVPPLIVVGAPIVPILRGVPHVLVLNLVGPLLRVRVFDAIAELRRPTIAWIAMNAAFVVWHIPSLYELALRSENWHNVEHLCFLITSIFFWWNVIEPWPSRYLLNEWQAIPYLLGADIVNTALSAYLCFSGRLIYPSYAHTARPFGMTALNDQVAAGAEMWVLGSTVFLVPVLVICFKALFPARNRFVHGEREQMQMGTDLVLEEDCAREQHAS